MRDHRLVLSAALLTVLLALATLGAGPALAQNEGGAGFVEGIETEGDPATGIDQEVDSAVPQAEQIQDTGQTPAGLSRRRASQVEEIVVSARRRAELLEDTPISVTAVSAETLVEAQVTRINQLQYLVPNLQISVGRSGNGGSLRIRGVGPTESGNPGVGTYVDGIFLQTGGAQILNVIDVSQVEVLRGPQGTLFGKNTLGGAVNFTTVAPADELTGSAWLRAGSFNTVETRAMLSVPIKIGALEDKVFTRWSFASANSDGWTYNRRTDEYHNNRSALWFLGKVRVLPIDDLEININANYFQNKSNGAGVKCLSVPESDPSVQGLLLQQNPNFLKKCDATQPYEFNTPSQMLYQTENYGLWGNITYNFGEVAFFDDLSAKLLGSWRRNKSRTREDIDGTEDLIIELTTLNIFDVQGEPSVTNASLVEGQLFGTALDGDITGVAGFFASWQNNEVTTLIRTNPPLLDMVGGFTKGPTERDDNDWALYGQATWSLLDWLSLTGGIRYTSETRGVSRATIFPLGNGTTTDPVTTSAGADEKTFTQWTPMASLQLFAPEDLLGDAPVDHLMGYFTYARGFSSGGFNAVVGSTSDIGGLIPFEPSILDNYEIGFKTVGFDQRATFNLALFYMDYQDIQVTQSRTVFVPGQELPENVRLIVNASSATLKGIEAEVMTRPIDGLLITGNIGVLDSEYGDFPDISALDAVTEINREGQTFNQVPEFTSYLAVQYSFEVDLDATWLDGWLTPRLDWYYQTSQHNVQPEDPSGHLSPYHLVNARLSYDFLDDRAQVALWGRNLADAGIFNTSGGTTGTFGYSTKYFAPPRSWGGEVSYRFSAG